MSTDRRPASVELMATLDEKHLLNVVVFDAMHITGVLFLDDAPRTAEGLLDRGRIRELVRDATWREPSMRQRLRPAPLRLTTPAWVPVDDVDLDVHVSFSDDVAAVDAAADARRFAAADLPPLDPAVPLWAIRVLELDDGGAALVLRLHHAGGDGIYGSRVLSALTTPGEPERHSPTRPPRNGVEQLVLAGRSWYASLGSPGAAWREYWRKPFVKRVRRWGGRLLRPVRNARIARAGGAVRLLPVRDWRMDVLEFATIRRVARARGLSVHDLLIWATCRATLALDPSASEARILVPISRRVGVTGAARNHISVTTVVLPRGLDADQAAAAVRAQLAAAIEGDSDRAEDAGRHAGYASFLPWQARPRQFGTASVRHCTLWPATSPADRFGVFGSSYAGTFTLAITAVDSVDIDALRTHVRADLLDAGTPAQTDSAATESTEIVR